jgi:hypothetical protein
MQAFPNFKPVVESIAFPGESQPQNLLMFKGSIQVNASLTFAIKIILVSGYPIRPPKAYVDQQLSQAVVKAKSYLGN